ncbi:MAG: hypothetical protein J1E33_00785 [Alistipes sp.]|nr:hypothetical protein [Alistipes sp.]
MRVINDVFEKVSYADYLKPDFELLNIAIERGFAESPEPDIDELDDPDGDGMQFD